VSTDVVLLKKKKDRERKFLYPFIVNNLALLYRRHLSGVYFTFPFGIAVSDNRDDEDSVRGVDLTGTIFDIQRFSVHDGPGIRTTVFMKGCPLRCKWCHNPEGFSPFVQLRFFEDDCIGCNSCGGERTLAQAEICPANALKVCGKEISKDILVAEILKDEAFYNQGGGVTFSGGECLCQADFVSEVLGEIKARGIHTAVDTSGYVAWTEIEKTLAACDIYLYDIKCITPDVHEKYTGVDNSLIIENFKRLSACNKDIWVRVPVIPGFNDNKTEMRKIAELIATAKSVSRVTLMPYHTLGASKYTTLGLTYEFDTSLKVSQSELDGFKDIFKHHGLSVE